MESLLVHKFLTKEEADEAMSTLNTYYKLPITPNYGIDPIITMFNSHSYSYHPEDFYYIPYNEQWTFMLKQPEIIILPEQTKTL